MSQPQLKHWPHAPIHQINTAGTYMVTAGTYQKEHFFKDPYLLDFIHNTLLTLSEEFNWKLQAWAIFSNHYHFVAQSSYNPRNLRTFLSKFHTLCSIKVNQHDNRIGRQVWNQFYDKKLTFQKSYLARLNYVNRNAVKHRLVQDANDYPWCSASWFESSATTAFKKTVSSFKTDSIEIMDDFFSTGFLG